MVSSKIEPIVASIRIVQNYQLILDKLKKQRNKEANEQTRAEREFALESEKGLVVADVYDDISDLGDLLNGLISNNVEKTNANKLKIVTEFQKNLNLSRGKHCDEQLTSWLTYRLQFELKPYARWKENNTFKRWFFQGRRPHNFKAIQESDSYEICSINSISSDLIEPWCRSSHEMLKFERQAFNLLLDSSSPAFFERVLNTLPVETVLIYSSIMNEVLKRNAKYIKGLNTSFKDNAPKYCYEGQSDDVKTFIFWTGRGRTPKLFGDEFEKKGKDQLRSTPSQIEMLHSGRLVETKNIVGSTLKEYKYIE